MNKELIKELDYIQTLIWAGINDEMQKRKVKYTIGDAYCAGSSIKDVLHPRVLKLLKAQKEEIKTQLQYAISDKETLKRVENLPALK